ncbi:hypothetical protein HDC92_004914 [Pedobacter sp. AK017]|uniref:hypothetical protein n=1 Tax=Pedobacter sp. AK017 TaxID=2723073 RepID=UPI0016216139|nr:hypothetical protein [Pedobacter sp. AK017]MBB5441207.1 hypothetical protein [Pedobacter sp. AK017]
MKELIISRGMFFLRGMMQAKKEHHLMGILLVLWAGVTLFFSSPEMSAGINQSIPLLVVLGLITYLLLLEMSWWLFNRFLIRMGYPPIDAMVLHFKELQQWQQLSFVWASYALLLLAGTTCLAAIL